MSVTLPHLNKQVLSGDVFEKSWARFFQDIWRSIGGNKEFNIGGILKVDTTAVGNVGSGEDTLITHNLPSTLDNAGESIEITAFGEFAANANNKTVKLYFGSTVIFTTGAIASNNTDWRIDATILRTGAATQISIASFSGDTVLVTSTATSTAVTETLSGALTIKCTGEATTTNDIIQRGLIVRYYPNA